MSKRPRVFSQEFKLMVVRRMLAGENVSALAREMKVLRKDLYSWRNRFRSGGAEALRRGRVGRPRKTEALAIAATAPSRKQCPMFRQRSLILRASASPRSNARLASKRSNSIFFDKPCGRSREHAGRATGLA